MEAEERIRKDYFVSSPAFHKKVAESLGLIKSLYVRKENIMRAFQHLNNEI